MLSLKKVMFINAISSAATGVLLVGASATIARLFGTDQSTPFLDVGIFLLVFSAVVLIVARKTPPDLVSVRLVIVADTTWVVVSLLIVVLQLFSLSTFGYATITAIALWVAAMAYLQFNGLKQINTN
jgi:hypothetical protein